MKCYSMDLKEAVKALGTSINNGLDSAEAEKRLKKYGANSMPKEKRLPIVIRFLGQFKDFMVLVLIAAAVISGLVEIYSGGRNFIDSIVILVIVIFNGIIGTAQEYRADKAIDALREITEPIALVLRDGKYATLKAQYIVPGDIIKLEAGDMVPADCRIIESTALKANESALTGETAGADKSESTIDEDSLLAERKNMLYMGTSIVQGRGKAVVTAIGQNTEIGKIAEMLSSKREETPLQKKLSELGKILGIGAIAICFAIFAIGVLRGISVFSMFMTAVSLAVAAIPEGLTAVVTIVLAIGVQTMAKNNAVVRTLSAVEALGNADVICSDKTGTITENKMSVTEVSGYDERDILALACLCCDGNADIGEATETGIVRGAARKGIDKEKLEYTMPRIDEIPFTSERKKMTTVHKYKDEYIAVTKGACEEVLKGCSSYICGGNDIKRLGKSKINEIIKESVEMGKRGLRVLAVAFKIGSAPVKNESGYVYCGLIALRDDPREGVKRSVEMCRKAGIRTVMITGDSPVTAAAVGRSAGIYSDTVTGGDIDAMTAEEFDKAVDKYNIFARVTPAHKYRIVERLKAKGKTVAFAGDGINDAPAIKLADIGCAMGKNGTEVARQAADIVLADDNFNTIVKAVEEGKGIYENILKVIHFLLSSNIGEILVIFLSVIMGFPMPLMPIQLLWVNLITDSMPAVALGVDSWDEDIMYSRNRGSLWQRIALEGCMIGALALLAFAIGRTIYGNTHIGRTMCFCVLGISQLFHAFNMRSRYSLLHINIFGNMYLVGALLIGIALQWCVVELHVFSRIFATVPLTPGEWAIVMGLSFIPIIVCEIEKRIAV